MPSFSEIFNVSEDLVYGVTAQRDVYIDRFIIDKAAEALREYQNSPADFDSDEETTQEYWTKLTQRSKIFVNAYNDPIIKTDFSQPVLAIPQPPLGERVYVNKLTQHPKLAPQGTKGATMSSLSKGDSSKAGTDKAALGGAEKADLEGLLAIRRACKFGIEFAVTSHYKKVHYVLDAITMTDVLNKTTFPLYSGKDGVPITTSELRFLFRNWNRFKGTGRVVFYSGFNAVQPPWETGNFDGWAAYALHLIEKAKYNVNATAINAAKAWAGTGNHKGVIGVFHNVVLPLDV
jgi:thiamine pyrophosphokinase